MGLLTLEHGPCWANQKCPRSWPRIMAIDCGQNFVAQIMTMVQIMIFWTMVPWVHSYDYFMFGQHS